MDDFHRSGDLLSGKLGRANNPLKSMQGLFGSICVDVYVSCLTSLLGVALWGLEVTSTNYAWPVILIESKKIVCFQLRLLIIFAFNLCIEALSLGTFLFQSTVQEPEEGCMQAQAPKTHRRFGLLRLKSAVISHAVL